MKKFLTGVSVFVISSISGGLAASAAYPPSAGAGGSPDLPKVGASDALIDNAMQYGNVALILGFGLVGLVVIRRRSLQN